MAMPFWLKSSHRSDCFKKTLFSADSAPSPMECETGSLDTFSLVDAASSTGDDFLMLDTPKSNSAQPADPADLRRLPEGQAHLQERWFHGLPDYLKENDPGSLASPLICAGCNAACGGLKKVPPLARVRALLTCQSLRCR
jgi:hypothetical protein